MLQKSITIVNEVKRKKKKLPSNFWIIKIDVKAIIVRLQSSMCLHKLREKMRQKNYFYRAVYSFKKKDKGTANFLLLNRDNFWNLTYYCICALYLSLDLKILPPLQK